MKKKSYLKTIEVVLAAIITTIFMLYIMPQFTGSENREKNLLVLKDIKTDDSFRGYVLANEGCTYSNENTAINTVIENYLPYAYDYVVCINDKYQDFEGERLFVDTYYMSANLTVFRPKTVRLYYWIDDS
ncbi:hypothetical protein HOD20_02215 [archaeon]|jgi:hypothetical protein|nr:hypothetical protein [archaeon]MBT4647015.1 hypothetical protein [archaeon]MBT6822463.1 hypothetical protein [archaeon]MBT7391992.1 hypothetical protein [archaeon]